MSAFNFSWIACLFVLICCGGFANGLYEGDKCTLKNGGGGTCKYLTECPSALKLIKTGVYPEICGFEGTKSIICCGDSGSAPIQTTTTTTTTTTTVRSTTTTTTQSPETQSTTTQKSEVVPLDITNRMPGDISKRKCKEYAQYAYDRSDAPTLALFTQQNNVLECAFEKLQLIVGGTLATRQEFPHMALIGYKNGKDINWGCGGSIISENYILTAGHCLNSREFGDAAVVRVGMTNQSDTFNMQEREIAKIIPYPKYVSTKYHDIGLLKLSSNLELDTFSRPACLQTEKNIRFEKAIASGWGKVEFSGSTSKDLLKVVLEFFDQQKCNNTYRRDITQFNSKLKDGILDELMICAGSSTENKDTCQGDSGGPLQVYHDDSDGAQCMYDIVGVTSFGKSCGLAKNVPGVYTRVSAYIKWIEDTVWPN